MPVSASFVRHITWRSALPIFALLLFFGSLIWAKDQDPFERRWFTLKTADREPVECVAVFPKPLRQYPVIIYLHGSDGSLLDDGNDLRQMAEMGLATVSLEYNQTNTAALPLDALLRYLQHQDWVNTNAIAWVGSDLGANCLLNVALQHPDQKPQLLVGLSPTSLPSSAINEQPLTNIHYPILFIHGDKDQIFPAADIQTFASLLRSSGVSVALQIIPGADHDMGPDRPVVFRCISEYCLSHLSGANPWKNYHSIAQWQAEAPSFWLFCLPAAAWGIGCLLWTWHRKLESQEKMILTWKEIALRWLATILAILALADTAIHLLPPYFAISAQTLSLARQYLVPPKEQNDFDDLATQSIWHGQKLKILLTHVKLAGYNRELINWRLDDGMYRDYVLSPVITGNPNEQLNWRRPLWEEFYPRIRHENSPEDAAKIVVRHLRERITIAEISNPPREVPDIWLRQITDKTGFEIIYVAALRSVGVPARLNPQGRAEVFSDNKWQSAPRPVVEQF